MRVLILTQWYPPEPVLLMQEFAQTLQTQGHDVCVLTGFPNYPDGRLHPGYPVRPWRKEVLAGVPVVRVPLYPEHSRSALKRVLNYLSFAFAASLVAPFLVRRPDVTFVYHPPLTVGIPAIWLSWIWRVPFVYQVQDLWPETLAATGMLRNPRILRWVRWFAGKVYDRAAAVCVISPGFRANLIEQGVPASKIAVVSNWVDECSYRPQAPDPSLAESLGLAGRFNLMFAGNIGEAQGLESVVEAAAMLRDEPDIQFVLVGDGTAVPRLTAMVEDRQLSNVRFLGRHPSSEMPRLYALADVLLLHLKDDPLFRITIPHKTFAYMASGKPLLAAIAGDAAAVVERTGAGLTCLPDHPAALAATVRAFHRMSAEDRAAMAAKGREAIHHEFTRERLVRRLEAVLRHAASRSGAPLPTGAQQ